MSYALSSSFQKAQHSDGFNYVPNPLTTVSLLLRLLR